MITLKRSLLGFLLLLLSSPVAFSGVITGSDLTVMKTGPDQAAADTNITYTIEVQNYGPDDATNASMTDNIPSNTTFVSLTADPAWSCSTPASGGGGTVTCTNSTFPAG